MKRHLNHFLLLLLMTVMPLLVDVSANELNAPDFSVALENLAASKLKNRAQAVDAVLASDDTRTINVIHALLANHLYFKKLDKQVARLEKHDGKALATDILTGSNLGEVVSRGWKKIIINNRIRKHLRDALADVELNNPSADFRMKSIDQILNRADVSKLASLQERLKIEKDDVVKSRLELTIALLTLKQGERDKVKLIEILSSSLHPSVKIVLSDLSLNDSDPLVKQAAIKALKNINSRVSLNDHIETLFFGLSLGAILALAAIGLAITFGVMGVINMAHGELIMLGAYVTYVVQLLLPGWIEYSLIIAIPLAFLISGLVGVLIERGVVRFLYGRPLETLLATFGVSLVLQQLVRSIFGPTNRPVSTPSWMSGTCQVNDSLALTWNHIYIIIFCMLVFSVLLFLFKKTRLGLIIRAVSQNRSMAKAMGIKANWVDAMTFGLGSGIAGIAGVALSQVTNVGPNLGQSYIIDSFMVIVFGGVGNLWGTLVAGLGLGIANKIIEPWSGAVLAKILILIFIILFIQKRPRGLFPQKGRAVED